MKNREQKIVVSLGESAGDPDALAALRNAAAVFELLESIDRNSWAVRNPRYNWEIVNASKASPFSVEARGKIRNRDYGKADVVGKFCREMADLHKSSKTPRQSVLTPRDLEIAAKLGYTGKKNKFIPVRISIPDGNGGFEEVISTPQLRRHAEMRKLQFEEDVDVAKPEYVVIEGLLRMIEADPRESRRRYTLALIERGTDLNIRCQFSPSDSEELGAHVGNRLFVEGYMTTEPDGRKNIDVSAFRLIPKTPLTDEDLKDYGIRTPDGIDAESYIEGLRADYE